MTCLQTNELFTNKWIVYKQMNYLQTISASGASWEKQAEQRTRCAVRSLPGDWTNGERPRKGVSVCVHPLVTRVQKKRKKKCYL